MAEYESSYSADRLVTGHLAPGLLDPFLTVEVAISPEVIVPVGIDELVSFAQTCSLDESIAYGSWHALRTFWNGIPGRDEYLRRSEQQPDLARDFVTELFRAQSELPLTFEFGQDTEIYSGQLDALSLYRTMEVILQPKRSALIGGLDTIKKRFLIDFLNNRLDPETYPPLRYINPRRKRK